MVEPITIVIAVTGLLSLFSMGINWFKKNLGSESPSPTFLSTVTQPHPPAILSPTIIEDTPRIEYDSYKEKKESLSSYESNDDKSSSNFSSTISLILAIALILGIMGFIIYRKGNKLKENKFRFREIESPPSPTTTQTNLDLTIV